MTSHNHVHATLELVPLVFSPHTRYIPLCAHQGFAGVDCSLQHTALAFDQPLTRPPSYFEYAHFTLPALDPRLATRSISVDVQASFVYGSHAGAAALHSLSRPELLLLQV